MWYNIFGAIIANIFVDKNEKSEKNRTREKMSKLVM